MNKTPNPIPFAPPAWQRPHLLALKPGERGLLVVAVEPQPDWIRPCVGDDGVAHGYCGSGPDEGIKCPLGPVGGVIAVEGVGDFRNLSVDLRRTDRMTPYHAMLWGGDELFTMPTTREKWARTKDRWNQDHPAQPWEAWAWFVAIERSEV